MAEIIEMPKLSDTMTTGTLVNWLVKEGDEVSAGDMLAEVETDKATMEVENFEDGVVLKLYVKEGESVAIGDAICAVGEKGEAAPDVKSSGGGGSAESKGAGAKPEAAAEAETKASPAKTSDETPPKPEAADESREDKESAQAARERSSEEAASTESDEDGERVKASPLARKLAKDKGVDLSRVKGTGPGGRIVKDDVLEAEKNPPKAAAASAPAARAAGSAQVAPAAMLEEKDYPVSNMRASIARALVKSKTEAPHFYLQTEVDGAALTRLRKDLNAKLSELAPEQGGIKFSVNDLILKAAAEAVRRVPAINRSWQGDKIHQHGGVQLAFGVAIDEGLVTPVIRDAHGKTLRQISAEAKELIVKARSKKLKPEEMSGSTLTVTNLGMYGITDFYGIINPGNAAILSIGATVKTPIVKEDGSIGVGYRMKVGLSGDHRVIDGAVGAEYLQALREILETPALMLV